MLPALSGYQIEQTIYTGTRTLVCRGQRESDKQRVVIKFLRNEYPTFSELLQFRNQYTIAKNLDIPGIVRSESLESCGNSYALVMADGGGISLREYAQTHHLELTELLTIALQLADILHDLHAYRVIHKDIKPANILIHPETKEVKLIDFSIASLLPKETQEITNPDRLEGTLAYLAPEQTGRMNRGIDYRSDFYALGVTLFELLAGQLPFQSQDAMELVHCHIAQKPPDLAQFNIPEAIAQIVAKLMAKNAENRYQSALGLKHDLAICLQQLKETGKIELFEIGTRDLCDRFIIPEKLYGREREVKILLSAFDRVANPPQPPLSDGGLGGVEMMLVAGFSGIGKTAVINEVHKPITRQHGYFIKGKFDQFNRNIPFSAFVRALQDLMLQLLSESDAQLAEWRTQILQAVKENGQVLIEVIPELERIIGKQPPAPELSGTEAQNRFNLLFQKFIAIFTTKEHPLVIFLDDLQWADSASLQSIKLLVEAQSYLLLLGAYRDNEVSPDHPFIVTVEELKKSGTIINTITLSPLAFDDTNQLVADTLHCDAAAARPLTELIDRKTRGNPFFTTQFLKALYEDGYIIFNRDKGYWFCDLVQLNALSLTDDVVEFMAGQLQKLSDRTQEILQLAACVGNSFDLDTLAIVSEQSEVEAAAALWKALQEGFILPQSEVYKFYLSCESGDENINNTANVGYRFLHDRVQQAAYSLIPESKKQQTHLKIGRLLLQNTPEIDREEKLFDIVSQLNAGADFLTEQTERNELAQLNLKAGQKAQTSTAYAAAVSCFTMGIELLAVDKWQTQYELTLALYLAKAEAAHLNRNFELSHELLETILQQANNLRDRVKAYHLQVDVYTAQGQMQLALETGLLAIEMLEITLDKAAPQVEDIEALIDLPELTDPDKLAAIAILSRLSSATYILNSELHSLIIFTMTHLCFEYGNSYLAPKIYAECGLLLGSMLQAFDRGYRYGQLSLRLLEKFHDRKNEVCVWVTFNGFIRPWKESVRSTFNTLLLAYSHGLESGEIIEGGYAILHYCPNSLFVGEPLESVEDKHRYYVRSLEKQRLPYHVSYSRVGWQLSLNLLDRCENKLELNGEGFNEFEMISMLSEQNNGTTLFYVYLAKAMLCYLFEEPEQAIANLQVAENHEKTVAGLFTSAQANFYQSLAILAAYPNLETDRQQQLLEKVRTNQAQMNHWAQHAPMNFQHKYDLVAAEKHRVLGNKFEALELYDIAIKGAKSNAYIHEAALANELAAKFYLDWGKERVAANYMRSAYYCYAKWGAKAKTNDLETRYPHLLHSIFQQAAPSLNPLETLTALIAPHISINSPTTGTSSASSTINTVLDFASIIKASQALSRTIQFEEMLCQIAQIILQNSGGDICALILPNSNGEWQFRAISTAASTEICAESIENNSQIPFKLIQYVKNTKTLAVIDDLKTDLPVICSYLQQQKPQSILCLPLLDRGELRGILYLENRLTSGVFASDRILILNFLCTQVAISLENAGLYQQAQVYARQLEQSQLQIVQTEKMASLGNLVAGVAHEINNPLGFLNGSTNNGKEQVRDLLGHLALYQQHYPNPPVSIQDNAEIIDLEFISEDLPKLLDSMKGATERIKSISNSLRTFSRADAEHKVSANLHEGIDSTLAILKYRLKANENRPAIEVITEYGNLPPIVCFPGQLNQVFMNILANAIDALDESNLGRSFAEIQANPNRITIETKIDKNWVTIAIADNGPGMPESLKSRIFDHLFTTKGVGKGTGLGLAIARQIVVEKHGGSIEVDSALGQGTKFSIILPIEG
ncbi:MAG: trifunctional serine/threonine-protein kinase/ATP-binding protein/sensor histidine kinase [Oscillatoriaceae cyanobacterium Prado104]|jgi:predicted ATPase/signal transduction histidine kinase|nr:trifunctional serine/threonine-protein kinase/ATP-binding protein/sensor histidine kinase [Oscillatoriaceae cyanobacterium Prado104]